MPHQQKRQFLAVLFADIQGYTALMQRDEEKGRLVLRNFKEILTNNIAQFQGKVINFYGDGCLCTFENPINAANCAAVLQKNFKAATPTTSVRIGLHQGNVGFEDGNAYGDAVNIASRIESFGIPGSVLISNKFKTEIADKTPYKAIRLGAFQFKNIDKPMQVYALQGEGLIIPNKKDLTGKGKLIPSTVSKVKKWALGGLVILVLGLVRFFSPF